MNRSPEKLDRFIRKAGGSANNSTLATPTKSNEKPNDEEPAVEIVQLDVSSGSKQKKELSPWMLNRLKMLEPFQKKILEESKNKTHAFEKRLNRLTQKYLRKVEEILKENKENDQTVRVAAAGAQPTTSSPSFSSTMTSSIRPSSTPSTSSLLPAVPSTSKTPTTMTLLNFFTHSQKETIVPRVEAPGRISGPATRDFAKVETPKTPGSGTHASATTPTTSGADKVEIPKTPGTPGKKVLPKIRMGGPPSTSISFKKVSTTTPRKSQQPTEKNSPAKTPEKSSAIEFVQTPRKTAETTPSRKEVDKNDIITLDDSDDDVQLVDAVPKTVQRTEVPEKQEEQHADVPELQVDADDEKEGDEGDGDDAMEGDSLQGETKKKRKRQRKGDDLFIDMNDKMIVDVEDVEEGRKLTRAARRSGGLNSSNLSNDPHVAGSSEEIAASPVKKKTKRAVTTDSEGMAEESMETATEESMDEADERLPNEVSHISLEDRHELAAVAVPVVDTRDRQPKPHHGRGDMVRWTCGGRNCTRAFGTHAQVYQHMMYDHPLRADHTDIVGLCECGLFADFPDLIVHRQKGDKATCGAPHSTLVYWTYDEMESEQMSEEEKTRKDAFSDLAEELRRCVWRGCSKHNFLFDTFEEMEEHNAKQHNIKLLYTCRVDHPDEKSIITCLTAPLFLEHERRCKSFCFPSISKIIVDKKRAKKEQEEREKSITANATNVEQNV